MTHNKGGKMNCRYRLTILSLAITMLFVSSHPAFPAQEVLGVWTDEAGEVVYGFKDNHEFFFRGSKRGEKDGTTSASQEAQGDWQTEGSICWKGWENSQEYGNLMVYVQSLHCCLLAKRLAGTLVLTKVWEGGYTNFGQVCQDRVLKRLKETTK
jgi:hypothetical protein